MLQLATSSTNSEGNWYIIWNFVSEEVKTTNGKCIPAADKLLDVVSPKLPEYPNLATDLFTIEHNDVSYVGNKATFILNSEKPYDILWWNILHLLTKLRMQMVYLASRRWLFRMQLDGSV